MLSPIDLMSPKEQYESQGHVTPVCFNLEFNLECIRNKQKPADSVYGRRRVFSEDRLT